MIPSIKSHIRSLMARQSEAPIRPKPKTNTFFFISLSLLKVLDHLPMTGHRFFQLTHVIRWEMFKDLHGKCCCNNVFSNHRSCGVQPYCLNARHFALYASFVSISTLINGLQSVGIGFITPRTMICSPFVIPPSKPPK